jgi:hypothetical protein
MDDKSSWVEVIPSLHALIMQGVWGSPIKLRADICSCPPEKNESNLWGQADTNWILLVKPEVRDMRGGPMSRALIPVRYPGRDMHRAHDRAEMIDGMVSLDDIYNLSMAASSFTRQATLQPMCVQLLPPVQICNLLPQPLLYRISDRDGLITSEGVLLPGEPVDIYSMYQLFSQKIYLSIRLLNYCWSKWTKIFTRTNPYPATEKLIDISLHSMDLIYRTMDLALPTLDLTLSVREHIFRISCPNIISNRTGLSLDFCESSTPDSFIPLKSQASIDVVINDALKSRGSPAGDTGAFHQAKKQDDNDLQASRLNFHFQCSRCDIEHFKCIFHSLRPYCSYSDYIYLLLEGPTPPLRLW